MKFFDFEHLFRNHEIWAKTIDFDENQQNRGILWILVFFEKIKRFDDFTRFVGTYPR